MSTYIRKTIDRDTVIAELHKRRKAGKIGTQHFERNGKPCCVGGHAMSIVLSPGDFKYWIDQRFTSTGVAEDTLGGIDLGIITGANDNRKFKKAIDLLETILPNRIKRSLS